MTRLCRHTVLAMAIAIITCIVAGSTLTYAGEVGSPTLIVTTPAKMTAGTTAIADVYLVDSNKPVAGAVITLTYAGAGISGPTSVTTDPTGHARVQITAGPGAGTASLTATYSTYSATKEISVAGLPASLLILPKSTLLNADGTRSYKLEVLVKDASGTPCNATPVGVTIDGTKVTLYTGEDGIARKEIGPRTDSHIYSITAEANGLSESAQVRFIALNLEFPDFSPEMTVGSEVPFTVILLDGTTPVAGVPLTFVVQSPENLATPSAYSAVTDDDGMVVFNFRLSTKVGNNRVVISNPELGYPGSGVITYKAIKGNGGSLSKIELEAVPMPGTPVLANNSDYYKIKVWAKDANNNTVCNVVLDVDKDGEETPYSVTTNSNGYAEFILPPSLYMGSVLLEVKSTDGSVTEHITLTYDCGRPEKIVLKAQPNVIASAEVMTPAGMEDVHATSVIAQVTDKWGHPIEGETVTFESMNTLLGTITGPETVVTDANGEAESTFLLSADAKGKGEVKIKATSGSLPPAYFTIVYTNATFISIDTELTTSGTAGVVELEKNPYITVDITLKGLGWQNRAKPSDVMLVMDRSGSMAWNAGMVFPDPASGSPQKGVLARNSRSTFNSEVDAYNNANKFWDGIVGSSKWKLLYTYSNSQSTPLTIELNSPSNRYYGINGNYYFLMVIDPDGKTYVAGKNYDGVSSSHKTYQNTLTINSPKNGNYRIYGLLIKGYTGSGSTTTYSLKIRSQTITNSGSQPSSYYSSYQSAYNYADSMYDDNWGIYNNTRWEHIATYHNSDERNIQIMLSSPYTNYDNGEYYNLMVIAPDGRAYVSNPKKGYSGSVSSSQSSNENYVWFTDEMAIDGKYEIYGIQFATGTDEDATYSLMVLKPPLRLGSKLTTDSVAKTSAVSFVESRGDGDQVGVVSFYTSASLNSALKQMNSGTNKTTVKNAINSLSASGGTDISSGIKKAIAELDAHKRSTAKQYIIVLTDGYSQYPEFDLIEADKAKAKGYTIFTIGMGMADEDTLKKIASKPEYYYRVLSPEQLEAAYYDIGQEIGGVIAADSTMEIISDRSEVNGVIVNNTEYVMDSAIVTHTNGILERPVNPLIRTIGDKYHLTWNPGIIKLNEVWKVHYTLKINANGTVAPITPESYVEFIREDSNESERAWFVGDTIYSIGTISGNLTNATLPLYVEIDDTVIKNNDTISRQKQPIKWTVNYSNAGFYTQRITIEGNGEKIVIALPDSMYRGDINSTGSYVYLWDAGLLQDAAYTVTVEAKENNGNVHSDSVTVFVDRRMGSIRIADFR
ncbi:VWA domain-containing protein [Methanocella arvoryzae]|nr:VWA domain-containing protein [Methanocella arvoryzae]